MKMTALARRLMAAALLSLAACSETITPTTATPPAAAITVSTGSPTLAVDQGASATVALSVARTNYSGEVTLSAEGLPTGVTATFTPAADTGNATTSSLTLAVPSSVTAGTSTVTIRARGTGVTEQTATVALTINTVAGGTVALAFTPPASTITAGQSTNTTLAITRGGGFTGGVNLIVSGAPSGLNFAFSTSNPVTANSVTLTLSATTSVVPGPYTLTVRASGSGVTEATTSYVLTVNAVPSNSVSWRYCAADRIPLWFAYQDGADGTWQRVTPTSTGQFDFAVSQPGIGVASVYSDRGVTVTDVRYYGLSELAEAAAAECATNPTPGTKTITGSITGFSSTSETARVEIGNTVSNTASQDSPGFSIPRVLSGSRDLIAVLINTSTNRAQRLLLIRATNFADNGSTGPLDLAAGTSVAPASGVVTVTAPNDGTLIGSTSFQTATNTGAALPIGSLSSGVATPYLGFPDAVLSATDVQGVFVSQNVGTTLSRSIVRFIRGPTAISMTMPADPGAPSVTAVAGASFPRATAAGTLPTAFNGQVVVQFDPAGATRRWILRSTGASRAGSLAYSLTMPDFSQVPGWTATWQLPSGVADVNSTFVGQRDAGPSGAPINGTTIFTVNRKTAFTF